MSTFLKHLARLQEQKCEQDERVRRRVEYHHAQARREEEEKKREQLSTKGIEQKLGYALDRLEIAIKQEEIKRAVVRKAEQERFIAGYQQMLYKAHLADLTRR